MARSSVFFLKLFLLGQVKERFPTKKELILIMLARFAFGALIIGLALLFFYQVIKKDLWENQREMAINDATLIAAQIDGDVHEKLKGVKGEERTQAYREIKKVLDKLKENNPRWFYVYTMVKGDKPGILRFAVEGGTDITLPGEEYDVSNSLEIQQGFLAATADQEITEDKWGRWLSGYAPIKNSRGETVALLGVDITADEALKNIMLLAQGTIAFYLFILIFLFMASYSAYLNSRNEIELSYLKTELEALRAYHEAVEKTLKTSQDLVRLSEEEILKILPLAINEIFGFSSCLFLLEDGKFVLKNCAKVEQHLEASLVRQPLLSGEEPFSSMIKNQQPIVYLDLDSKVPINHRLGTQLKCFGAFPLITCQEVVGMVGVGSQESFFKEREVKLVGLLVNEVNYLLSQRSFQKEIERSEMRYRTLFEYAGNAVVLIEKDTTLSMVNKKFEELSGYKRQEVEGKKSFADFLPPEEKERLIDYHFKRRENPAAVPTTYEAVFVGKDGEERLLEITVGLIPKTQQSIASLKDITERKKLEREFQAVVLSMADGLVVTGDDDRIVLINPVADQIIKEFFGAEGKIIGKNVREVMKNQVIEDLFSANGGGKVRTAELCFNTSPLSCFKLSLSFIKKEDGKISGKVLTFHDISEEKRLSKMKSEFVSIVSHELRTPLTAIIGYGKTLLRRDVKLGDEAKRNFIKTIVKEGERLARLVDDMLDLSRIESGSFKLDVKPVDVREVVERVMKHLKQTTNQHHLVTEFRNGSPQVLADPDKLEQVLVNLIGNAVKYSPSGGEVKVSVYPKTKTVEFCISDQGIGIKPDEIDHIFEPFFRTEASQRLMIRGTGLGLPVVKGILQQMDGHIWVESQPGKGSSFYFELPKVRGEKE
jgi:two-component system phosphate regulon sensor histidine kinase PhoR